MARRPSREPPPIPKSTFVYRDMRRRIVSGEWKEKKKLPDPIQLSEDYKVEPSTIREALYDLANDGYIVAHHEIGTYVNERKYWPDNESTQRYGRIVGRALRNK